MPHITSFEFDSGKLRHGDHKNTDGAGDPIISRGYFSGDGMISTSTDMGTHRYKVKITATKNGHNKTWKGRIVGSRSNNSFFQDWIFVVVNTENLAGATDLGGGDGEIDITVQVTNPDGSAVASDYSTSVQAATIS